MPSSDNIIDFSGKPSASPGSRPLQDLEDDELMLMTRGGVEAAFDIIARRYQQVLFRVASRVLGQTILAEDAIQNTFLALYNAVGSYEPRGRFKQFLFQILINECRIIMRSAGRFKKLREELAAVVQIKPGMPDEDILEREKNKEVNRALSRLGFKLRIVVVLRFAGGLSYSEIGQALKIPVGTVKSRLNTGIVKMRKIVKGKSP